MKAVTFYKSSMRHLLMPLDARTAISMPIYTQFKKKKQRKCLTLCLSKHALTPHPIHIQIQPHTCIHHKLPTYFTSTTDCMYRYTQTQVSMHKHNCTTHTTHGDQKNKKNAFNIQSCRVQRGYYLTIKNCFSWGCSGLSSSTHRAYS